MKVEIVFICGSLGRGQDGVGDYCRKLAAGLLRSQVRVAIIALKDHKISGITFEKQYEDGVPVPVLRLGGNLSSTKRFSTAKKWIEKLDPEWISLQFVLFSFHSKGLPLGIESKLKTLGTDRKWHIMFHELWIGMSSFDSLKDKVIGTIQRNIIVRLISEIKPEVLSTNTLFYKKNLRKLGLFPILMPVFSNLPKGSSSGLTVYNFLPQEVKMKRKEYLICTFFGKMNPDKEFNNNLLSLRKRINTLGKKLFVTHIGKCSGIENNLKELDRNEKIEILFLGEFSGKEISDYFCQIDLGLSTHPKLLFEKSGSIAAFLNNDLPVLLTNSFINHEERETKFIQVLPDVNLPSLLNQKKDFNSHFGVEQSIAEYLKIFQNQIVTT